MRRFQYLVKVVTLSSEFRLIALAAVISFLGCSRPASLVTPPGTAAQTRPAAAAVRAQANAPTAQPSAPTAALPIAPKAMQPKEPNKASNKKNLAIVKVYYATDRSRTSQSEPHKFFGATRGNLTYGSCEVSIPRDGKMGKLEQQASLARLQSREQSVPQPTLRKVVPREYDAYMEMLRTAIAKSSKKDAFVFVHGYNVTFAEAARRTAQMKYDLGFDGAPIFFSWPSKGRKDAYPADEADVEWAQPDLKEFLKDVAGKTQARNIYLIAHSMGNRALAKAYIYLISERPELKKVFREVILIAPDIDSDLFKRDIAPALAASSNRITLYSSSKDLSLKTSTKYQDYPRAGDSGANLLLYDGIETIDATNVNTGLIGHHHVADNSSVLADIYHLIRDGKKPTERSGLKTVNTPDGQYWRFKILKAGP
jgi:esterase/lipase superfamily enzyme